MSGSVWYISFSKKKIEFKRYPKNQRKRSSANKKTHLLRLFLITVLSFSMTIFLSSLISAEAINDTFHINLQTTYSNGSIQTGTFAFAFNITENSNLTSCEGPIVYNHSTSLTTDSRGIISLYLPTIGSGGGNLSSLSYDKQYYLCYSRDGTLKDVTQLGRVPYAFRATQVNLSEVAINSNLNLNNSGQYNITANYGFFSNLGSLLNRITNFFAINGDISNNLTVGGNLTVVGSIIGGSITANNSQTLDGYDSSFFMPLNQSVYGNFDFNGGWQNGGFSISGGDIYAQTAYFYNITSLNVTRQNLTINDDLLVFGNTDLRKNLSVSGNALFVDNNTGRVGIGTTTPQNTLNVVGTFNVTNTTGTLGLYQDSNGEVGIGVSNPSNPLEIATPGTTGTGRLLIYGRTSDFNSAPTLKANTTNGNVFITDNVNIGPQTDGLVSVSVQQTSYANSLIRNGGNAATNGFTIRIGTETTYDGPFIVESGGIELFRLLSDDNASTVGFAGIGTSLPTAKLTINLTNDTKGFIIRAFPNQTANLQEWQNGTGTPFSVVNANGSFGINTSTPQNTLNVKGSFNVSNVSGSTSLFVDGGSGRVGIGTNSPGQLLQVGEGDASSPPNNGLIRVGAAGGGFREWDLGVSATTSPFNFQIGQVGASTPAFYINYLYNRFGIGPGASVGNAKLSVLNNETLIGGNMRTIESTNTGATFNTNASAYTSWAGYFSSTSTKAEGSTNNLTNVGIYASASGADTNYAAIFANGNVGINTSTPQNTLNVVGDANITSNLTVDNDTFFVDGVNNRVGIGTNSLVAGNVLTIKGSVVPSAHITYNFGSAGARWNVGYFNTMNVPVVNASIINLASNTDLYIRWYRTTFDNSTRSLIFTSSLNGTSDAQVERMRITGNGSVGINTTSPTSTLHVVGNASISTNLAVTQNLSVDVNTLFVNSNLDRIGISTSSPLAKLDVNGKIRIGNDADAAQEGMLRFVAATGSFEGYANGTWVLLANSSSGNVSGGSQWITNGTAIYYTGGYVGIGTGNPQKLLDLADVTDPAVRLTDTTNNVMTLLYSTDNAGFVGTSSEHNFGIISNNTERITLLSTGLVGIGTTNPQNLLNINGDTNVTGAMYIGTSQVFTNGGDMIFRLS